jgi:Ca2+-binding EF-hand superfamily protein
VVNFSTYNESKKELIAKQEGQIREILSNLNIATNRKGLDLKKLFTELDKKQEGKLLHETFTSCLKQNELVTDPKALIMLANRYKNRNSGKVSYSELISDLVNLNATLNSATEDHIRDLLLIHSKEKNINLYRLFMENSSNNSKQTIEDFKKMTENCGGGFKTLNKSLVIQYFNKVNHRSAKSISFFNLLSGFPKEQIKSELATVFLQHKDLYDDIKKVTDPAKIPFKTKFGNCSQLAIFAEEVKKMPLRKDLKDNYKINEFCALFEDHTTQNKVDPWALEFVDNHLPRNFTSQVAMTVEASSLIAPGTSLTFGQLKDVQLIVKSLNKFMSDDSTDYLAVFGKFDKKNSTGLVTSKEFE